MAEIIVRRNICFGQAARQIGPDSGYQAVGFYLFSRYPLSKGSLKKISADGADYSVALEDFYEPTRWHTVRLQKRPNRFKVSSTVLQYLRQT